MSRIRQRSFSSQGGGFAKRVIAIGGTTLFNQGPQPLWLDDCTDDVGKGVDHTLLLIHEHRDVQPLNGFYAPPGNTYEYKDFYPSSYPVSMSHNTVSYPSTSSLATTVRARSNPSKPYVSIPNFLYELKDLPAMIRDIGYLKLQATNLVHKAARQRMTGKSVGLAYANHQLAVQMGWMPLINDLKHLLDFQARVDRKIQDLDTLFNKKGGLHRTVGRNPDKPRKTSSKSQSSLFSQTVSATGIINCDTRLGLVLQVRQSKITEAEAWGTIRWHSTELPGTHWSNKELAAKARSIVFGANINPKAIWDAIPWTWLIGWFANVDEFLSSNTNVIPVSGSNVCMMFRTRTTYTFDRTDGWQAIFLGGYGKATYEHKQRLISSGSLSASVPFIGAREFSILGALAMQRLPR